VIAIEKLFNYWEDILRLYSYISFLHITDIYYLQLLVKQNASLLMLPVWQIVNKFFTPKCSSGTTMPVLLALATH
jgi:hypothetical protein